MAIIYFNSFDYAWCGRLVVGPNMAASAGIEVITKLCLMHQHQVPLYLQPHLAFMPKDS